MVLVSIEFLSDPSRPSERHLLSRVPSLGEGVAIDGQWREVRAVCHLPDPQKAGEPVAIVRVKGA